MKNDPCTSEPQPTLLAEQTAFCRGEPLHYSLLLCVQNAQLRFAIEVRYLDERARCEVGQDLCGAVELLGRLCRSRALPCTLEDIVEDYFSENA